MTSFKWFERWLETFKRNILDKRCPNCLFPVGESLYCSVECHLRHREERDDFFNALEREANPRAATTVPWLQKDAVALRVMR